MSLKPPFVVTAYTASGALNEESDCRSAFEADTTAQRLSAAGNIALVKDHRNSTTKLIRVWLNGKTIYRTAYEHRMR